MARKRGRRLLLGVAGLALVACAPALWAQTHRGSMYSVDEAPERPVAIVFGASVVAPGQPSAYLEARLQRALELYQAGKVKVILVSGDHGTKYYDEPATMRGWLIDNGVPADKVVKDDAGFDTYDTCVRAKKIFGVTQATLVSQSYHLPRALATCQAVGLDTIGVGDESVRTTQSSRTWRWGVLREMGADWKMVRDVITHREPTLGPPEPGVRDALAQK